MNFTGEPGPNFGGIQSGLISNREQDAVFTQNHELCSRLESRISDSVHFTMKNVDARNKLRLPNSFLVRLVTWLIRCATASRSNGIIPYCKWVRSNFINLRDKTRRVRKTPVLHGHFRIARAFTNGYFRTVRSIYLDSRKI